MNYKFIAADVDGTLLNSKGEITEATVKAVEKCKKNNVIFSISSGRPIQGIKWLNEKLNLDTPFITYNGAMVVKGKSGEIIYEQKLSYIDAKKVINIGEKYDTTILVWAKNKLYANKKNIRVGKYGRLVGFAAEIVCSFDEIIKEGVTKILFYDDVPKINKYQKDIGQYLGDKINYHTSKPMFLEFVDKNASKAIAMEKIGKYFNIKREEMIAIGDGYNDLSMIEYAGLGIVMKNAPLHIKSRSDFVTKSNDDDGVAYAINKYIK